MQPLGDLGVRHALAHEVEQLAFMRCQHLERIVGLLRVPLHQVHERIRGHHHPACSRGPDRVDQILLVDRVRHHPRSARSDQVGNQLTAGVDAHHEDAHARHRHVQAPTQLRGVRVPQVRAGEDHVRAGGRDASQCVDGGARLADDEDLGFRVEQTRQRSSDGEGWRHEEQPDRLVHPSSVALDRWCCTVRLGGPHAAGWATGPQRVPLRSREVPTVIDAHRSCP